MNEDRIADVLIAFIAFITFVVSFSAVLFIMSICQ